MPVTIEIIDEELGIVGTRTDVFAKVNAPQLFTSQSVAINQHITRVAFVAIIMSIGGIPFQNDFILAIAIHIANTGIVG